MYELLPVSLPYGLGVVVFALGGSEPLRIYGSWDGTGLKTDSLTPKFLATTDGGVWAIQSSTLNVVPVASKLPDDSRMRFERVASVDGTYRRRMRGDTHCRCQALG